MGSFVFAVQAQVSAGFAFGFGFITLLASQTTCEAALRCFRTLILAWTAGDGDLPDLDLLCILEAFVAGESLVAGAAFFPVEVAIADSVCPKSKPEYTIVVRRQEPVAGFRYRARQGQDYHRTPSRCVLLGGNGREDWPAVFAGLLGVYRRGRGTAARAPVCLEGSHSDVSRSMVYMKEFESLETVERAIFGRWRGMICRSSEAPRIPAEHQVVRIISLYAWRMRETIGTWLAMGVSMNIIVLFGDAQRALVDTLVVEEGELHDGAMIEVGRMVIVETWSTILG